MCLYLEEKQYENTEYWCYPDGELDEILSHFWFELRTQRPALNESERNAAINNNSDIYPERYTIASLRNLRNGLS